VAVSLARTQPQVTVEHAHREAYEHARELNIGAMTTQRYVDVTLFRVGIGENTAYSAQDGSVVFIESERRLREPHALSTCGVVTLESPVQR
jgi:hypothetical protein